MVEYIYDKVEGMSRPTLYPGESSDDWEIPEGSEKLYNKLNSIIEQKYSREYLKVCAFYNKMFPSLKSAPWEQTSYNTIPFTTWDQERSDTGTGINFNYLKQIVDHITSRIGTISFVPALVSEDQSLEYIVYKDEAERVIRTLMRRDDFNRKSLEAFHNASVLCFSHVFMDPWTHELVKASDYEIGMFESQFNKGEVIQMLYRDYAFPVTKVYKYINQEDDEIIEMLKDKTTVDFKMYIDADSSKAYVTINNKTLEPINYPFDHVLIDTFSWDTGFSKVTSTSLFDLLYPCQREINKIAAKIQQLIRNYKGPIPVFNSSVDLAMKEITNGTGECLYVNSQRAADNFVTVINPTPLDPQLSAEIQNYKTAMYELSGMSQTSFNMDNMRSAAAVVALDQTRDTVFQAQLSGMADFIKRALMMYVEYFAKVKVDDDRERENVDWEAMYKLMKSSYVDLKPVHINDLMSDENAAKQEPIPDYTSQAISRVALKVIKGELTYDNIPYWLNKQQVTMCMAELMLKFEAVGIEVPVTLHYYMISAYLDAVKRGEVQL